MGFYDKGFLQPGVPTVSGLTTRVSYNQGSFNQGFLQPEVLEAGVLTSGGLITRGFYNQGS